MADLRASEELGERRRQITARMLELQAWLRRADAAPETHDPAVRADAQDELRSLADELGAVAAAQQAQAEAAADALKSGLAASTRRQILAEEQNLQRWRHRVGEPAGPAADKAYGARD